MIMISLSNVLDNFVHIQNTPLTFTPIYYSGASSKPLTFSFHIDTDLDYYIKSDGSVVFPQIFNLEEFKFHVKMCE